MTITEEKAREALAPILTAETSASLAAWLKEKGYKGYVQDGSECPLAVAVHALLPDVDVEVDGWIRLHVAQDEDDDDIQFHTDAVWKFVSEFDTGGYPELDLDNTEED